MYRCELCDRWFCERHVEPRLAFIRDLKAIGDSPEVRVLYYTEMQRENGHPDFEYSRRKFTELDIEEQRRSELIEEALDKMNAHYRGKHTIPTFTPKLPKGKKATISEGDYHFEKKELPTYDLKKGKKERPMEISEREPSRRRQLLNVDWRSKNFLLSLKLWFIIFWVTVGLLFLIERGNPVQFYHSVPDPLRYALYVFASIIGVWSGYRVFEKCDYNPRSDRGLFALKLLSGGILVVAVFTMVFSIFFLGGLFTEPQLSLGRETMSTFLIVLSFVLIITSAYLVFKFERRSGIIVYRR